MLLTALCKWVRFKKNFLLAVSVFFNRQVTALLTLVLRWVVDRKELIASNGKRYGMD